MMPQVWTEFFMRLSEPCPKCGGEMHVGNILSDLDTPRTFHGQTIVCQECRHIWTADDAPDGTFCKDERDGHEEWAGEFIEGYTIRAQPDEAQS